MYLRIIIIAILIAIIPISYATDTEHFDIAFPIDYQIIKESDWSDTGNFTVLEDNGTPPPQGADTEYFDIAFTTDYVSGNGGLIDNETNTDYLFGIIVSIILLNFLIVIIGGLRK